MHRSIALRLVLALVASLALAPTAAAGGWATVHLDAAPEDVAVGVPVRIGLTVLAHDVHPVNPDRVVLDARHRGTGEAITAEAVQEGAVGHHVVEVAFPAAGAWKWSVTPEPYAETSFETLTVLAAPASGDAVAAVEPAQIVAGTCAERGAVAHPLSNPTGDDPAQSDAVDTIDAATGTVGSPDSLPVAISETTLDVALAELVAAPHAISVDAAGSASVCGDVGGRMWDGALVVGLQALGEPGESGVATLREEAGRTTVTLYLLPASTTDSAPAEVGAAQAVAVQIVDAGGHWGFSPSQLAVPAGTTVVWTNATAVAHTITGDNLAFADSGPMAAGDTFRQTFTAPGIFTYRCGPHPAMVGTITVT